MGTVKETIQQVSMSKKWDPKPALDEHGKPLLNANGKTVLRKSYSVLQDDFFAAMRKAGYDDVERGERGWQNSQSRTVSRKNRQQRLGAKLKKSRTSGSMCGLSKKSWQRPFPSHPKLPWSVRTLTDFPLWQRSTLQQRKSGHEGRSSLIPV